MHQSMPSASLPQSKRMLIRLITSAADTIVPPLKRITHAECLEMVGYTSGKSPRR